MELRRTNAAFGYLSRRLKATPLRRVKWIGTLHSWIFRLLPHGNVVQLKGYELELDARDSTIAKKLALYGEYEPFTQEVMLKYVREGSTVLDVGANIGLHTIPMAQRVGPNGRVIAFEPDPDNFRILSKNIERNGVNNVAAHQLALSSTNGTAMLYQCEMNRGGLSLCEGNVESGKRGVGPVPIRTVTGDDLLGDIRNEVSLIKIDVEGAEPLVIGGLSKLLKANRDAVVIFEYSPKYIANFQIDPMDFLEVLEGAGFGLAVIDDEERRVKPMRSRAIFEAGTRSNRVLNIVASPE